MAPRKCAILGLSALILVNSLAAPLALAGGPFTFGKQKAPATPIDRLATAIDRLEKELNNDGTVVVKAPDVWGEARLMRHRQEFEEVLAAELKKFELRLNVSISRSDQAFLANALAIQAALTGNAQIPAAGSTTTSDGTSETTTNVLSTVNIPNPFTRTVDSEGNTVIEPAIVRTAPFGLQTAAVATEDRLGFKDTNIALEPTIVLDQMKRYVNHLHEIRRLNEGADTADAPGYALQLVRVPVSVLPGDETRIGHGAEVTVTAEPILSRELLPTTYKRIVKQDLKRAFSGPLGAVLNGRSTRQQVAKLIRTRDDRVEALKEAVAQLAVEAAEAGALKKFPVPEDGKDDASKPARTALKGQLLEEIRSKLGPVYAAIEESAPVWNSIGGLMEDLHDFMYLSNRLERDSRSRLVRHTLAWDANPDDFSYLLIPPEIKQLLSDSKPAPTLPARNADERDFDAEPKENANGGNEGLAVSLDYVKQRVVALWDDYMRAAYNAQAAEAGVEEAVRNKLVNGLSLIGQVLNSSIKTNITGFTDGKNRNQCGMIPFRMWSRVYGRLELAMLSLEAADRIVGRPDATISEVDWKKDEFFTKPAHPQQIEKYLGEQIDLAYELLLHPENEFLWHKYATPQLVEIIRSIRRDDRNRERGGDIDGVRDAFFDDLSRIGQANWYDYEVTGVYAWAILVHATLLNERLKNDIRRVTADRNCACSGVDVRGLSFHFPNPGTMERRVFNDYVSCKWPIRVFALDPVTQDQNVADAFSLRREMQLSLALAFAAGRVNAQNMTRFVRRFELDMQTIALNRPAVAFGHGEDTFGWRFRPRVQTPDERGTLPVFFGDLLLGQQGKDMRLKQHRIEPGMRECTALVIMPSFLPYVRFDVRTNWYELTDPDDTRSSMQDTVRWSRMIQSIKTDAMHCLRHEHMYQPGLVDRMVRRSKQLARRLPIQELDAQMPLEYLPCGTTLFANGSADLAPELHYSAAPQGINKDKETHLLLKGANFSVLDTRVLVGDQIIPAHNVDLISREIMKVTIPAGVRTKTTGKLVSKSNSAEWVDVHIATPYGVTSPLSVPVHTGDEKEMPKFAWKTRRQELRHLWRNVAAMVNGATVTSVDIPNRGIQVRPPHRIEVATGTDVVPHDHVDLSFVVSAPNGVPQPRSVIATGAVRLRFDKDDSGNGLFVIDGSRFNDFQKAVRDGVESYLTETKQLSPSDPLEVPISAELHFVNGATRTIVPVDGELKLLIQFQKLP